MRSSLDSSSNGLSSQFVADSLFLSWSIGLLSASAPWRMICAMTASSILNISPKSLQALPSSQSTIRNYYSRIFSTVSRRMWAERSALPICSLYIQSFIDLSSSVRKAKNIDPKLAIAPTLKIKVDAATPIPFVLKEKIIKENSNPSNSWEWDEGWLNCDAGWELWTGYIEYHAVDWTTPSRSAVRSLTDGGEGPPMLREGCIVMRGLDWDDRVTDSIGGQEDGKNLYEGLKNSKEAEIKDDIEESEEATPSPKRKIGLPKLPVGKVISIEPWKGVPGLARRVKWNLTKEEGLYRYGGDGGRYDIAHIEVNEKSTRIRKRYPLPESLEQCAARYGFGRNQKFSVLLRCHRQTTEVLLEDGDTEISREGILEMPDFGAGILVECKFYDDGAVAITEKRLLFGSKDSGWEPRFGQPSYVPGTTMVLTMTNEIITGLEDKSPYVELLGSTSYTVKDLRNRSDGGKIRVTSEMHLLRSTVSNPSSHGLSDDTASCTAPPPICFDKDFHAPSLSLSRDCRTVTCTAAEGRCTAFGSIGFTKGVHYWEVKIEHADTGSVFIGVAEKPPVDSKTSPSSFASDGQSRLNRWLGWGFVNFRATYSAGSERVYGAHCHAGDTIGVLLDCDAGRLSFFYDGVKYGEHIMNDLGCAYENISPFGFNANGCGNSGAGQGAPNGCANNGHGRGTGRYPSNGSIQPKALWPVVGMRHPGDRVTFSGKWITNKGVDAATMLTNTLAVDEILSSYGNPNESTDHNSDYQFPDRFLDESFGELSRWEGGRWIRCTTRGSGPQSLSSYGLDIDIDTTPLACAIACASLGLKFTLLPGDRVRVKRSAGRLLELAEEARVLGAYQGRLWYQIVSQKSEGGSLSEGGGRAWFWDESEVVENSLQLVSTSRGHGIELPLLDRFKGFTSGALKIIYSGGAVVRSDLEIFEGSENIGTIPEGTIIPCRDILERRMNSCGVYRLRVQYENMQGWISSRIRGGNEEAIVEYVSSTDLTPSCELEEDQTSFQFPRDSAELWLQNYNNREQSSKNSDMNDKWLISDVTEFRQCVSNGVINGMSPLESDSLLSAFVSCASNFSNHGDALETSFELISSIIFSSGKNHNLLHEDDRDIDMKTDLSSKSYQAAASLLRHLSTTLPPIKCLLARIAMLRALNRRVRYALPYLSVRPPQECSTVLGGIAGFGSSLERCGKSNEYKQSSLVST